MDLKAPERWEDLSLEQLRSVANALQLPLAREERLLLMMNLLTGASVAREAGRYTLHHEGQRAAVSIEELYDLAERFAWIIDTEPNGTRNPSKADDNVRDMTFGDWFEADTHFRLYAEDGDLSHFQIILPAVKEQVRTLPPDEAQTYLWWWISVSKILAGAYPNVFQQCDENDYAPFDPFRQLQNFHLLLNDDRPQDDRLIDETNVHNVLAALDNKIAKMKAKQEELKKIGK